MERKIRGTFNGIRASKACHQKKLVNKQLEAAGLIDSAEQFDAFLGEKTPTLYPNWDISTRQYND
ncbi:hypothetical protein ACI2OX_09625 [Bacillus sp. N9]